MKTDAGHTIDLSSKRIDELIQILGETSGKVIIWANYIHDIERIEANIHLSDFGKDSCCTYYGATPTDERQECIRRFQDPDSKVRFFIGNTQTGGYGITLTAASTVIYYSNNYDLEKRIQSEDRAHRIGQKNKVLYIDLVARGTVDEKIIQSLAIKLTSLMKLTVKNLFLGFNFYYFWFFGFRYIPVKSNL